jgi:hypothetical protein
MKNLKIETPKFNTETLRLMSTLYVNEAEDLPLSGAVPAFFARVLHQIQIATRATFKHKRESEIATGESVVLVRFNNERHYRVAIHHNKYSDFMAFTSPYFNTSNLSRKVSTTISAVSGSSGHNTVTRDSTKKCFHPDVKSIMKRIANVEPVSDALYEQWCFLSHSDAIENLTAANEPAAIKRLIGQSSRYNTESLSDGARIAAFHMVDNIIRGTPIPPGALTAPVAAEFHNAFKKTDTAREDDAAARGKTLVQVIKRKASKDFMIKCGDTVSVREQLPDNVAVAAATVMTVGGTVLGVGAQVVAHNPALDINMVLLIEGAL